MPITTPEQDKALQTYLNDHFAGSVAAIELAEHLFDNSEGAQKALIGDLLPQIKSDQNVLKEMITRVGGTPSRAKTAASWLAEKVNRFKLAHEQGAETELSDEEQLEALVLGIHGKLLLWRLLGEALQDDDRFSDLDFRALRDSARQQRDEVERFRLEAAHHLFRPSQSPHSR